MTARDRLVAAITDYLNGVAYIDTGDLADAIFAALRPVIAAEIREYAKQAYEAWEGVESYATDAVQAEMDDLALSADDIADRITTTGDETYLRSPRLRHARRMV